VKKREKKLEKAMENNIKLANEAEEELVKVISYFRRRFPKKSYSKVLLEVKKHIKSKFEARKASGAVPVVWTFAASFFSYMLLNAFFNPMDSESLINKIRNIDGIFEIVTGSIIMLVLLLVVVLPFSRLIIGIDRGIRRDIFIHGMMLEILEEKIKNLNK
jgi:ABC-type phosphate transport system permease subunit